MSKLTHEEQVERRRQGLLRFYAQGGRTEEWNRHVSEAKMGKPSPNKGKSIGKGILKDQEAKTNISRCLVVWDDELNNTSALKDKIMAFVGGAGDE